MMKMINLRTSFGSFFFSLYFSFYSLMLTQFEKFKIVKPQLIIGGLHGNDEGTPPDGDKP